MTIIRKVKTWIRGAAKAPAATPASVVYVPGVARDAHQDRREPHHDQLFTLRRISTFAAKENVRTIVVFTGQPLRRIPDGSTQDAVTVRYAASAEQLPAIVDEAFKALGGGQGVVLVADQPELRKQAQAHGVALMQVSTYHKALDGLFGPLHPEPRKPKAPPPPPQESKPTPSEPAEPTEQPDQPEQPEQPEASPKPPPQKPKDEPRDPILDLIDPL